jgi:gluconolactonase
MKLPFLLFAILFLPALLNHEVLAQKTYPTMGKVIYDDPAFEKLLPKTSGIEVLASGFSWSEGPVWNKDGGYLLFSDVPENKIYKWNEKTGLSVFLTPSGYTGLGTYSDERGSNGLAIDNKGRLIISEHGDRRISAMSLTAGGKITLTDNFEGKRLNSPNDVVQHPTNKMYYFTDPPYGLPKKQNDPSREVTQFGVYRIDAEGKTSLQIADLTRPNGLAFSPDGKTLYIAQSHPERAFWMAYPVDANGNVGKGKLLYDATAMVKAGKRGLPDGFKLDRDGNLWTSGPGGLLIISPAGKLLGRIDMGELTSNCAWGDDGSVLYMTVNGYLCRIRTSTTGLGW